MAHPRPRAFPRAQRIRKRADFIRIQTGGRRVTARHFLVLIAARPAGTSPGSTGHVTRGDACRLGLVASRKMGGAVARNRAKRLMREAFRRFPELFPEHVDVVVILRAGAGSIGLEDVVSELRSLTPVLRRRAREALTEATQREAAPTPAAPHGAHGDGPAPRARRNRPEEA